MGGFDINTAGFVIVGMFVLTWAAALCGWKFGYVEELWSTPGTATELIPPTPTR